jgi:WD40 repeat protein
MRWGLGLLAAAVWCLAAVSPARCEDQPVLMLDTGGHQAVIRGIAFTADGKYLVSAGEDKVVRVWDWRAAKTVRTFRGQVSLGDEGTIYAMALSPNGRWLAVGGWLAPHDRMAGESGWDIRLYDFATGELKALLKEHTSVVFGLAFSADSKLLISGAGDGVAIIWDIEKRQPLQPPLKGHTAEIYGVGFSPDGLRAVTSSYDKTLRLWSVADGRLINVMMGHGDKVAALAVLSKDGTIASGDASGEIRLWDGRTGDALSPAPFAGLGGWVGSLSFSPDGRLLLATCGFTGCNDTQKVFEVTSGKELETYSKHDNTVFASAFSPDGRLVATGGGNSNEIYIWDPRSGDTKATLKGTGRASWAVAFSRDGRRFAWGSTMKHVGQNNRGALEMTLRLPSSDEPLGEPEPVSSQDGWLRAQDHLRTWSLQHKAGGDYGHPDAVLDIVRDGKVQASITRDATNAYRHSGYSFTPDGKTVISGGDNGLLIAYRRDGTTIGEFVGHESEVWAMAVSPDGRYLVTGSGDQTVRLWDVKSLHLLVTLFYGTDGEWVMWTPEGFYTSSKKGAERVGWHINHGSDKAADFVNGEQLRDAFFRPDLVAAKIAGDPDGKVRDEAAQINIDNIIKSGMRRR